MGKLHEEISPELGEWIAKQRIYFVSTAPLAADGLINNSPKGIDSLRILGPKELAYLDLTGSGVETIAHLRENGRISLMFCAFDGPPKIVRVHGVGEVVLPTDAEFESLKQHFPDLPGVRSIVRIHAKRISDSCGYAVPKYEFVGERDTLLRWAADKGNDALANYRRLKNAQSIDGLPGLAKEESPSPKPEKNAES